MQQVWDGVYEHYKHRIDAPLVKGVFDGLLQQEYLRAISAPDGTVAARISDKGRSYYLELKQGRRARALAYVGAGSGIVSLVWQIVDKVMLGSH
jgi:hypothetical protein